MTLSHCVSVDWNICKWYCQDSVISRSTSKTGVQIDCNEYFDTSFNNNFVSKEFVDLNLLVF